MPSITSWIRLDPITDGAPDLGLAARIHDPLWLVGRQWQLGELLGEDAASAIEVECEMATAPLARFYPGPLPAGSIEAHIFDARGTPLEVAIEQELVDAAAEDAAELLTFLDEYEVALYREPLARAFPFTRILPPYLAPLARHLPDSDAVRAALGPDGVRGLEVAPGDKPKLRDAIEAWIADRATRYAEPPAGSASTWDRERLGHRSAVSASAPTTIAPSGQIVLEAPNHRGDLDWSSFDLVDPQSAPSLGATTAPIQSQIRTTPTPVRYRGQPHSRFWEIEDTSVELGGIALGAGDVARAIALEFALVYADDWLLVPLELATGAVHVITRCTVTDSMGDRRDVTALTDDGNFCLHRLATAGRRDNAAPLLLLPPAIGAVLESDPFEEVRLIRDEAMNVWWAVEANSRPPPPTAPRPDTSGTLTYDLGGRVPPGWLPLLAEEGGTMLKLGALLGGASVVPRTVLARELADGMPVAAIPSDGIRLTRHFQLTRCADGTAYLWIGRRVVGGVGSAGIDLAWDATVPAGA